MANPRYHLRRPPSKTWRLRLQYPKAMAVAHKMPKNVVETSLGTTDVIEAQRRSATRVQQYLLDMMRWQAANGKRNGEIVIAYQIAPGTSVEIEGDMRAYATEDGEHIDITKSKGEFIRRVTNCHVTRMEGFTPTDDEVKAFEQIAPFLKEEIVSIGGTQDHLHRISERSRVEKVSEKARADRIFDFWRTRVDATASNLRWVTSVVNDLYEQTGKHIHLATREDARKLGDYYINERKIMPHVAAKYITKLSTIVRASSDEDFGTTTDVFRRVIVEKKQRMNASKPKPQSMADEDVRLIMAYRSKLPYEQQLLLMLVASCGLRPKEALSIQTEKRIDGLRCFGVGTKGGKSAYRELPFPDLVLELPGFPKQIKEPLFKKAPLGPNDYDALEKFSGYHTKKMGGILKKIHGGQGGSKRFYAFRHRAIDRLRTAEIHPNVERYVFGHAEIQVRADVHLKYGDNPFAKPRIAEAMRNIWHDL